ncbi:MAG: hypothetical protein HYW89_03005 [Candidatus Sungiibacteriota bacterium]|uniref:Uncharacterized protein n=1 Tax=Candidatus Sungiibacteriota bacterium TaxID=2750080 RepID=A0A7T5RIX6_9BACT|nr:MAG: hypothetical protein HYW89_03005 [Candidatus Sungbacteria bacterium]
MRRLTTADIVALSILVIIIAVTFFLPEKQAPKTVVRPPAGNVSMLEEIVTKSRAIKAEKEAEDKKIKELLQSGPAKCVATNLYSDNSHCEELYKTIMNDSEVMGSLQKLVEEGVEIIILHNRWGETYFNSYGIIVMGSNTPLTSVRKFLGLIDKK